MICSKHGTTAAGSASSSSPSRARRAFISLTESRYRSVRPKRVREWSCSEPGGASDEFLVLDDAGLDVAEYTNMTFGAVAMHSGFKLS